MKKNTRYYWFTKDEDVKLDRKIRTELAFGRFCVKEYVYDLDCNMIAIRLKVWEI